MICRIRSKKKKKDYVINILRILGLVNMKISYNVKSKFPFVTCSFIIRRNERQLLRPAPRTSWKAPIPPILSFYLPFTQYICTRKHTYTQMPTRTHTHTHPQVRNWVAWHTLFHFVPCFCEWNITGYLPTILTASRIQCRAVMSLSRALPYTHEKKKKEKTRQTFFTHQPSSVFL